MHFSPTKATTLLLSAAASLQPTLAANPSHVNNFVARQGQCDALACARATLKDAAVGAFCVLAGVLRAEGPTLCSIGVTSSGRGPSEPCKACVQNNGPLCNFAPGQPGGVDLKAQGKACGPGNLAELGKCIQLKSSVPNPDPNTDVVNGNYVIHCANTPQLPSGLSTDGGTCTWDCSQCQQCVDAGKASQVVNQ